MKKQVVKYQDLQDWAMDQILDVARANAAEAIDQIGEHASGEDAAWSYWQNFADTLGEWNVQSWAYCDADDLFWKLVAPIHVRPQ